MHVFGRREEAGVPGENPRIHGENMLPQHYQGNLLALYSKSNFFFQEIFSVANQRLVETKLGIFKKTETKNMAEPEKPKLNSKNKN